MEIPPCGALCENCLAYRKDCPGCIETGGRPHYVGREEREVCPVWECAADNGVEHCGLCEEFPCEMFLGWYSRRRGIITVLRRAGLLALRKRIGDEAWKRWIKDNDVRFGV